MNAAGMQYKGHYPAQEIASLGTRFSGKRLETDYSWKVPVKKIYY